MTVVINGDTGVTSVNGSAATPSVTGADSDTGIVYGTNTLSLATGGVTAVTVDSGQNMTLAAGLTVTGTTTAALFSGSGASLTSLPAPAALSTASGSAPSYSARAWVNFKGTGTVTIRGSGNVTSVSDNTTADWTVNFTTAMPDANYAFPFGGEGNTAASNNGYPTAWPAASGGYLPTASALRIRGVNGANGSVDLEAITVAIFR